MQRESRQSPTHPKTRDGQEDAERQESIDVKRHRGHMKQAMTARKHNLTGDPGTLVARYVHT